MMMKRTALFLALILAADAIAQTPAVKPPTRPGLDYVRDTAALGTNTGPITWTAGYTNFIETAALTADRNRILPLTTDYADGTKIQYRDSITIGAFGPLFFPQASETLKGSNATAWTGIGGYAPFKAGGYGAGSKSVTFQKRGTDWQVYSVGGETLSAFSFRSVLFPHKEVTVDVEGQGDDNGFKFIPSTHGHGHSVFAETADNNGSQQVMIGLDGTGRLIPYQLVQTDIDHTVYDLPDTGSGITNNGRVDLIRVTSAVPMTATHTYNFPNVDSYKVGDRIEFVDLSGTVGTGTSQFTINFNADTASPADNIDGSTAKAITAPYQAFEADPDTHTWKIIDVGGGTTSSGTTGGDYIGVIGVSNVYTINCALSNRFRITLSANSTLAQIQNAGTVNTIYLRVVQGSGGQTLTGPAGTNIRTPAGGAGLFDTSAGASARDEFIGTWDGTAWNFATLGKNFTAAAAASCTTPDTNAGTLTGQQNDTISGWTTTSSKKQGDVNAEKWGLAMRFFGEGNITNGASYTICKADLSLLKAGTPPQNIKVGILNDNGANAPNPSSQNGSNSASRVADTDLTTGAGSTITFTGLTASVIGPRAVSTVGAVNGSQTLTKTGGFQANDAGTFVFGTGIPPGAKIDTVDASNNFCTMSAAFTGTTGNITATIKHPYWLTYSGDNAAFNGVNYTAWNYYQLASGDGTTLTYKSTAGTTFTAVAQNTQMKFTLYR